jgi:hypothetical protein
VLLGGRGLSEGTVSFPSPLNRVITALDGLIGNGLLPSAITAPAPLEAPGSSGSRTWEEAEKPTSWARFPLRLAWWALGVLAAYVALLAIIIPRHEPWFDEAQAWLLVRDSNVVDLLTHYLRYEGSPPLWHLLLLTPAKLGFPYATLNILSAIAGTVGVYVFLRYSPFPPLIKVLLPLSFFIFYQYAVVARSYCLAPMLVFLIAATYSRRFSRVYPFMAFTILLENVSVQGMLIAGSIVALHAWELLGRWKTMDAEQRRQQLIALGAFGAVSLALVAILWPPTNHQWVKPGLNLDLVNLRAVVIGMLNHMLAENRYLSLLALIASAVWFWRRRVLMLFLVPTIVLLLFAAFKYHSVWHEGLLFLVWVFALWMSLVSDRPLNQIDRIARPAMMSLVAVVLAVQVVWSFNSFRYDYGSPYTGSQAVANYIKANHLEKEKIYATSFESISILPYFKSNIFDNYHHKQNPSFWDWSTKNDMVQNYRKILLAQPDVVIMGVKFDSDVIYSKYPQLWFPGYTYVGTFPGEIFWKTKPLEHDEYVVWRKSGAALPTTLGTDYQEGFSQIPGGR